MQRRTILKFLSVWELQQGGKHTYSVCVLHKTQPAGALFCSAFYSEMRCCIFLNFSWNSTKALSHWMCVNVGDRRLLLSRTYLLTWETGPRAPNLCHRNGSHNCGATWKEREKNRTRWTPNCAFVYVRAPKQVCATMRLR